MMDTERLKVAGAKRKNLMTDANLTCGPATPDVPSTTPYQCTRFIRKAESRDGKSDSLRCNESLTVYCH